LAVCASRQDRRVTPIVLPEPDLETSQSLDTSGKTTFEKPALPCLTARGVEVRTISAGGRDKRDLKRNPVFTRLCRPCD
jgi:hypothetical protein